MSSALILTLVLAGAQEAPVPEGLSWSEARSLGRKLEVLEKNGQAPANRRQSMVVTEAELNSYLNLSAQMPEGLRSVQVRLEEERVQASGLLDLERVRGRLGALPAWNPLAWLSGEVPVLLRGRLVNGEGVGAIEWEDVRVGSWPVPSSLFDQIVASATRSEANPAGVDIRAPFRLPWSLRRVRLQPGRALLDF